MLTKTKHKWLDVYKLFADEIIRTIEPSSKTVCVKYFTAPIKANFCSDKEAPHRQQTYHNALQAVNKERIEIVHGDHQVKTSKFKVSSGVQKGEIMHGESLEEKKTDVNLSLAMYRDACFGRADHIVLVSNDSDFAPAVMHIKADYPNIKIGVILPGYKSNRRKSRELTESADWAREYIREEEIIASQMPNHMQNKKNKTIRKPKAWF